MKLVQITISGRVQGVWFRAKTKEKAEQYGIRGIVKNLVNGKVYIEAEGSAENLAVFVDWCKVGPKLAHVAEIVQESGDLKNYADFHIVR